MNAESLFRVSLKGLILNDAGDVLVVKEAGRPFWDLPGGGMEHGETLRGALAREMFEETGLVGNFQYEIIAVDDPHVLARSDIRQVRLIFRLHLSTMPSAAGADTDEMTYIDPTTLKESDHIQERMIYTYWSALQR